MIKALLFLAFIGAIFGSIWMVYESVNPHRGVMSELVLEETGEEIQPAHPDSGESEEDESPQQGENHQAIGSVAHAASPNSDLGSGRPPISTSNLLRPQIAGMNKTAIASATIHATTNHALIHSDRLNAFHNPAALIAQHGFASGLFEHGSRCDVIPCDLAKSARFISGGIEVDTTLTRGARLDFYQTDPAQTVLKPGKTYRITYDYTVVKSPEKLVEFYHYFANTADRKKTLGFQLSIDQVGASSHNNVTIRINSNAAYAFVLGVKSKCVLQISNLKIAESE